MFFRFTEASHIASGPDLEAIWLASVIWKKRCFQAEFWWCLYLSKIIFSQLFFSENSMVLICFHIRKAFGTHLFLKNNNFLWKKVFFCEKCLFLDTKSIKSVARRAALAKSLGVWPNRLRTGQQNGQNLAKPPGARDSVVRKGLGTPSSAKG